MDRLAELNPSQREAVLTLSGPLLVLAGAGTGKTRVITHRTAELIRSGVPPERILSVTFTNKAAREMQERTAGLLGKRLRQKPRISTFHSLCVRILRQEIPVLGYPRNFAIYDRGDQESTARAVLREIRIGDDAIRPRDLLAIISRWKMAGVGPGAAADFAENDREFLAAVAYRKYQQKLQSCGAVDFDDLLLLTNRLFLEEPEILQRHRRMFEHVQIDEYQDTNAVQFQFVEMLVAEHGNLCVVGDDDQSIYGWRGAEVEHILGFQNHFPGARVVRLEDNYRCTAEILEVANRLVRHNPGRHKKRLIAHRQAGPAVRFLEFPDEAAEAEGIVGEIASLIGEEGATASEIAILFRTNEQPRVFETEFRRLRIPYTLIGGQSFFDRREIRDMLAYLKTILNPNDETSLLRIINTPARGIGTGTTQKLLKRAVLSKQSLWEVVPAAVEAGEVSRKAADAVSAFRGLLARFRREFNEKPARIGETMLKLIGEINYEAEIEKLYKSSEQQLARSAVVEQLIDSMKTYTGRNAGPSLAGFLEEAALLGREEESDAEDRLADDAVKLMTLHSAKGLEFPRVYLVGLEEGLLPHQRSLEDAGCSVAEERRLAYVGVTRAMVHLTISRAAARMKWGKRRPSIPSRFLFEMRREEDAVESEERGE